MKLLIIIAGRNDLKRSETIMSTKVMIQLIADYFKTQPVLKAWLFGSFARGEETEDSDLDILVEYDKNARISLLTISHMMGELEKSTGRRIDLIEDGCLLPFAVESLRTSSCKRLRSRTGIVNTEDSLYIFAWKFESFQR